MNDDKRAERLLKKARPFLDEKLKHKQRLKSLLTFLESANDSDQIKFFQDHDYSIYMVAYECFTYRVSRIREKADRIFTPSNKDVIDLFETLSVIHKVLRFSKAKIRQGWQMRSILGILEVLLATGNHQRVRLEGIRILLQYLSCYETEPRDYAELYSDAIDLNLFDSFALPVPHEIAVSSGWVRPSVLSDNTHIVQPLSESAIAIMQPQIAEWKGRGRGALTQKPIQAGKRGINVSGNAENGSDIVLADTSKIILYPSTPPTREEQCELFEEVLKNVIDLVAQLALTPNVPDSNNRTKISVLLGTEWGVALRSAFMLLRSAYLRVLFPRASRRAGIQIKDGEGFETCPLQILHLLVRFLARTVMIKINLCPESSTHEIAAAALVEIMLGDPINRVFVHEILSQALLAPVSAHSTTRAALFILATWIFAPTEQKHAFLRVAPDEPGIPSFISHTAARGGLGPSGVTGSLSSEGPSSVMNESELSEKMDPSIQHTTSDLSRYEHIAFNHHIRRYIHLLRLVFLNRPVAVDDIEPQTIVFHETLDILRVMTVQRNLALDAQTWECLMLTLMDIQSFLLQHPSQSLRSRTNPSIVRYIAETVLVTWVRSRLNKEPLWRRLRVDVVLYMGWQEYARGWADLMVKVTRIMADKVYDFDGYLGPLGTANAAGEGNLRQRAQRKTVGTKPNKDLGAITGSGNLGPNMAPSNDMSTVPPYATLGRMGRESKPLEKYNANALSTTALERGKMDKHGNRDEVDAVPTYSSGSLPRERDPNHIHRYLRERISHFASMISTATSTSASSAVSASSSIATPIPLEFLNDDDISDCRIECHRVRAISRNFSVVRDIEWWNAENTLWVWKSLLCAIGRVRDIKTPSIHYDVTLCLVQVWDALDRIRQNQKFRDVGMPALFDFASTIFECADMSLEYADTIVVASGCVCRIMCRRHDQPFSPEYYAHFYRILDKWLKSEHVPIMSSILLHSSKLFSLCLPGAHTLIRRFLDSIVFLSGKPDVSESVSASGIQIIASLVCVENHYLRVNRMIDQPDGQGLNPAARTDFRDGMHSQASLADLPPLEEDEDEDQNQQSINKKSKQGDASETRMSTTKTADEVKAESLLSHASPLNLGGFTEHIQKETNASISDRMSVTSSRRGSIVVISATTGKHARPSIVLTPDDNDNASSGDDHGGPVTQTMTDPMIASDGNEVVIKDGATTMVSTDANTAATKSLQDQLAVFKDFKHSLLDAITNLLSVYTTQNRDARTHFVEQLLWNVGIMTFDELEGSSAPDTAFIQNCIELLLDHIYVRRIREISAAADCLSLLAQHYTLLQIDQDTAHHVIDRIVFAISDSLQLDERARKQVQDVSISAMIGSKLFRCLVEWLGSAPKSVIANPNIALRVSEVIEEAIHVSYAALDAQNGRNAAGDGGTNGGAGNSSGGAASSAGVAGSDSDSEWHSNPDHRDSSVDDREIISKFRSIRSNAENTIVHLLHHIDNFAPIHGPAMMHALINEPATEDDETDTHQFFTLNGHVILSFADTQKGSRCRLIVRDASGKYAWDLKPFYRSLEEVEPVENIPRFDPTCTPKLIGTAKRFKFSDDIMMMSIARSGLSNSISKSLTTSIATEMEARSDALAAECAPGRVPDVLEQLLVRIGDTHPDCLRETDSGALNSPAVFLINDLARLDNISNAMGAQIAEEKLASQLFHPQPNSSQPLANTVRPRHCDYSRTEPVLPQSQRALFQSARLLLSQLGFLSFDYLKDGEFQMLSKTPSLVRDIKGLDRKYSREVLKVAIIYVAPGQEDEYSIFRNSCGSFEYEDFVSSLGWEVDLAKHPGYLGGLERSMVNGGVAPYYCTSTLEIMYHDVTKMPTDPSDPKQLKKKRHIGNDHVHIIWNEHFRDYRWDTIGGDFGNAQIAITPLVNGMYAVDTYRDDSVRSFGPLQSRSVVTKSALGPLVRATTICAYRAALFSGQGKYFVEPHPFTSRRENIALISSRHKMASWTFEKVSEQLLTHGRGGRGVAQGSPDAVARDTPTSIGSE